MELEELMTQKSLLAKMSEDQYDVHSKDVANSKGKANGLSHTKPREIRVEYRRKERKTSRASRSSSSPTDVNTFQPTLVIEGYGCKCPVMLKRLLKWLWIMLLVLYMCGMPVFLVRMDGKLRDTKFKLDLVEERLQAHFREGDHVRAQASVEKSAALNGASEVRSIAENNYRRFAKFEQDTNSMIAQLERKIRDNFRRVQYLQGIERLFNDTKPNSTFYIREECGCQGPVGPQGAPGSRGDRGSSGPSGVPGNDGEGGSPGMDGMDGDKGDPGQNAICICRTAIPKGIMQPGNEGARGSPGQKGDPGTPGDSENFLRGDSGFPGTMGLEGQPGLKGDDGEAGETGSCLSRRCTDQSTGGAVYIRWGRSDCPSSTNSTKVYDGYVGSAYHTHEGGGSNYLCLPKHPTYSRYDPKPNRGNRAYIHGVEFEVNQNIFDTASSTGQYYDAVCAVCQTSRRRTTLMIPARITCPAGWVREYFGYLMAQQKYLRRTEYICVDHRPEFTAGTESWGKGGFLHFVETRCGILPCKTNAYREYWEVTCVVCSIS